MEAVQKDHWCLMVLLISLPLLKVSSQRGVTAAARPGEEAVLECLCPWSGNLSMLSWTRPEDTSPLLVFHPVYGTQVSPRYSERVRLLGRTPLDGSIAVANVTRQDLGLYHCSVHTFPLGVWTTDVELMLADEDEPEVTGADAKLAAETSDNLTVSCRHEHNGSVYQVTMEKLGADRSGGATAAILARCRLVGGDPVQEEVVGRRGRVSCTDRLDVSLHLTEVVEEDAGVYRCRFHTDAGELTTAVLLTVAGPVEPSLPQYMIYIYMGCGVAGSVLLFGIFILVTLHRKRKRREEYRVKLHPAHRQPCNHERKVKHIGDSPVYANIQSIRLQTKRKR